MRHFKTSKKFLKKATALIAFIFFLIPQKNFSAGPSSGEGFNAGDMILHHIYDAHEWHIFDWKGKSYSVPLPIILYHQESGFDFFMSSKFNHGKDIYRGFKLDHGNIVIVDENGNINEDSTAMLWDFSITKNVFSLFFSILILLIVFTTISKKYKKNANSPLQACSLF